MADLSPRTGDDADVALLVRARAGDSDAFGEIYTREVDAARRLARILVGEQGADELVSESFARVLTQLQAGRGPTDDFRAYLHVTIRNGFRDGLRATKESPSSDQPWLLDDVLPPVEELVEDLDREVAVTALATLPKSWQQVLWHLEVEGRKPADVATILDMDAGAVSSLAYRAREGLKRAYLDQHLQPATGGHCGWTQSRMSQYVRGDLSPRAQQKVADHLDECETCSAAFLAVDRVNKKLAAWLFPVVLWGVASAHKGGLLWIAGAGATGAGGAGSSGTPTSGPSGSAGGPASNPIALGAAAAAVACAVAGSVALALTVGNDKSDTSSADPPAASRTVPPSGPNGKPPADNRTDTSTTGVVEPFVDPQPDVAATPVVAEPSMGSTTPPADPAPGPTDPTTPPTTPPKTPPNTPPNTQPPPTVEPAAPRLTGLEARHHGLPVVGPWKMGVNVAAEGSAPMTLKVEYRFREQVVLLGRSGAGWRCDDTISALNPFDGPVSCVYAYSGGPVPEIILNVVPVVADPRTGPAASVRLYADGKLVDSGRF